MTVGDVVVAAAALFVGFGVIVFFSLLAASLPAMPKNRSILTEMERTCVDPASGRRVRRSTVYGKPC